MNILVTVLLTILKALGVLLLVLLLLLLTALFIPVGGQVIYEGGRLTIRAKAGPLCLTVYPWPFGKKKRPEKKKNVPKESGKPPEKAEPKPQPRKAVPPKPADKAQEPPKQEPKTDQKPQTPVYAKEEKKPAPKSGGGKKGGLSGLPWEKIASALELLPQVLKALFGTIRIYDIRLTVPVHKEDAAATAIWYGRVNGLIGGVLAAASHVFRVEVRELNVLCDYTGDAAGRERFSCRITTHLFQTAVLGITTLIQLKKRKII